MDDDKFDLYPHQQQGVAVLERRLGRAGLFMQMRTGKSRTALAYLHGKAAKILIVAPSGAFGVWRSEIAALEPYHRTYTVLLLSDEVPVAGRAKKLEQLKPDENAVVVTNYQAYWRSELRLAILRWQPDAVICDEAHKLRHHSSKQSKFAHLLSDRVKYALALTGTPIVTGVQDLYSIYRFIDPEILGKSWAAFCQQFLIFGGYGGYQIVGRKNLSSLKSRVAMSAYSVKRSECFEEHVPKSIVRSVTLSPATAAVYETIRKDGIVQLDGADASGNAAKGTAVAKIVLTTVAKLQQVTSGFCRTEDGQEIDLSDEKLQAALDIIDEATSEGEQVVVFCRYLRDIARMKAALDKAKIPSGVLQGAVKITDRDATRDAFARGELRVVIAQIQISLGIDLSAASTAIFYSTGFALDDFEQSRDRLQGKAQTKSVAYYSLVATLPNGKPTIDHKIYESLSSKKRIASEVMSDPALGRALLS